MAFDMNAGRRRREKTGTTESQIALREQLKLRNRNLKANGDEANTDEPIVPTGMAAEKPCFITIAIPECIKRILDGKVRYDSKELPIYNQTLKHIGRRWFLRGLLAENLITHEQFDKASALHSEYGWERDRVSEKRRRTQ